MIQRYLCAMAACAMAACEANASFHVMQIEQVMGGVNGDTTQQMIQLRLRALGQNLVSQSRIRAWDAAGANPVLVINMTTNVAAGTAGSRVLITSAGFVATPGITPDFTMTSLIPASYMAAGSLTFEDDFGTVYWRLSWGGAGYTGSNAGNITNDANGNFGPPWAGALPTAGVQSLLFQGGATAPSVQNSTDYALSTGTAVVTNNAGDAAEVGVQPTGACCVGIACLGGISNFECGLNGGTYQGNGIDCKSNPCDTGNPCPPDIAPAGGNGQVDIDDLTAIILAWGTADPVADIDDDGDVEIDDLTAIILGWGACP